MVVFQNKAASLIKDGLDLVRLGKYEKAKNLFCQSVAIHPTVEGYRFWAWMLSIEKDFLSSIKLCLKAIELNPKKGTSYFDLATYLVELGSFREAFSYYHKSMSVNYSVDKFWANLCLARLSLRLNKPVVAIRYYKKVLNYDLNFKEAMFIINQFDKKIPNQYQDRFFSNN